MFTIKLYTHNGGRQKILAAHPRPVWWRRVLHFFLPRPTIPAHTLVVVEPEPPTLIAKLRYIASMPHGCIPPQWLYKNGSWATGISEVCTAAADELERVLGR